MRKCFLLFIVMSILLTGCSIVEADRIYTVCQIEDGVKIAYNPAMEFVQIDVDGNITPHSGAGVTARPVLSFHPTYGDYVIESTEVPNKYKATLESVEMFALRLLDEGNASLEIAFASWRELDIYVTNPEWKCRLLWDIDGNLRIYFVDNYNNAIEPLYLNRED